MIPRALNAPLSWIGLMRVSEHERQIEVLDDILAESDAAERLLTASRDNANAIRAEVEKARDDWKAEFKRAATDLAKQAEEIARKDRLIDSGDLTIAELQDEIASLTHDANMWRNSLSSEPVAYLYEKKGYQSVKFIRELWLTLPDRGWAETPLFSLAAAQGIAAPTGGKTGTGLTVGKSPTPSGDAPNIGEPS